MGTVSRVGLAPEGSVLLWPRWYTTSGPRGGSFSATPKGPEPVRYRLRPSRPSSYLSAPTRREAADEFKVRIVHKPELLGHEY